MTEDPVAGESKAKSADFWVIHSSDWVNVVALTDEDDLVLVEQWRHGVGRPTIEIPGGMIDAGESPADAARRELLEETGYSVDEVRPIGVVDPNPAIQSNRCHTFLALGARSTRAPTFDTNERCRVLTRPWADVDRMLTEGTITHALVVAGLAFARIAIIDDSRRSARDPR